MSMRPVHMCQAVLVVLEVGCCGACMTWMSFSISMIWIFLYIIYQPKDYVNDPGINDYIQ